MLLWEYGAPDWMSGCAATNLLESRRNRPRRARDRSGEFREAKGSRGRAEVWYEPAGDAAVGNAAALTERLLVEESWYAAFDMPACRNTGSVPGLHFDPSQGGPDRWGIWGNEERTRPNYSGHLGSRLLSSKHGRSWQTRENASYWPHNAGMRLFLYFTFFVALAVAPVACARLNHPVPADTSVLSRSRPGTGEKVGVIRVATYNVHMESASGIQKAIQKNAELRVADVLLLQEIEAHDSEGKSRAEQVAEALDMSFAYAPGYGLRSGGSHGVAILSRFPLRDVQVIELPFFHVVVNSARRVALAATVSMSGQDVRIISVHLDNRINPGKRKRQMEPALEAARRFSGSVIIAGDLNTSPFCWVGNLVPIPCGLQDNAMEERAHRNGLVSPVANIGATSKWLSMKLDAIYTRGFTKRASAVESSVRLSDHLPMWVDLELVGDA